MPTNATAAAAAWDFTICQVQSALQSFWYPHAIYGIENSFPSLPTFLRSPICTPILAESSWEFSSIQFDLIPCYMSAVCHVPAAWQPDHHHRASCCWYTLCHFLIYVWLVLAVLRLALSVGAQNGDGGICAGEKVRFSICLALLSVVISYEYITIFEV